MRDEQEFMLAPPPLPGVGVAAEAETVADYSRREFDLREWMDEPCTYAVYRRAALDLATINKVTRGYRPLLRFLTRLLAQTRVGHEPLHIVDVGCAQGEALRVIARWAARRSLPLKLTGVDMNPYAARLARECDREQQVASGTIQWVTADAFAVELDRPPDVILSSLFAHHLSNPQIERFLQWSEENARVAWFVGDLRRSERAAYLYTWLTRALRSCAMVKHDGVVSFRRALSIDEWRALAPQAQVKDVGIGRLVVERVK